MNKFSDDDFRAEAKRVWENEGEIEIDDEATVSQDVTSDQPIYGAYVQAWVWVQFDEEDDDEADECANNTLHPTDSCPAEEVN